MTISYLLKRGSWSQGVMQQTATSLGEEMNRTYGTKSEVGSLK